MSIDVCGGALISDNNLLSHAASCVAALRATHYASVVDSTTTGSFLLDQLMAAPDIINRFPVVECLSFISPAQSASENPTRGLSADLSYFIQRLIFPLR